jgi:hypothetical protein
MTVVAIFLTLYFPVEFSSPRKFAPISPLRKRVLVS